MIAKPFSLPPIFFGEPHEPELERARLTTRLWKV